MAPANENSNSLTRENADVTDQDLSGLAALPQELVAGLGAHHLKGRSFKIRENSLLGGRYLLTVPKNNIAGDVSAKLCGVFDRLKMPAHFLTRILEALPDAGYVHFGVEQSNTACVYKAYLEFWSNWTDELEIKRRSEPFLGGYGFKWDALNNNRHVLTEYTCYPSLPLERMLERVAAIYQGPNSEGLLDAIRVILETAASRIPFSRILYLEASEENNPRRSYDINAFQARVVLQELRNLLSGVCHRFSIEPAVFEKFFASIESERFGHIAGGTDRGGKDFLTIYYGVEQI